MRGTDGAVLFNNAAAGTSANVILSGGRYVLTVLATGSGGTVTLQEQGPDGATFVAVIPAVGSALTAAGTVIYDLPPGTYNLVISVLSAITAAIARVPTD